MAAETHNKLYLKIGEKIAKKLQNEESQNKKRKTEKVINS